MIKTAFARSARLVLPAVAALAALAPVRADVGTSGWTELLSYKSDGTQIGAVARTPVVSADGRFVAYSTRAALLPDDMNGRFDIYVLDRETGQLACASTNIWGEYGDGDSKRPTLSADGRWLAFDSRSTNLAGLDLNGDSDVFVRDLQNWEIRLVSRIPGSVGAGNGSSYFPSISNSGRFIAFQSLSDNLVPGDSNGSYDIFVHDQFSNTQELVSVNSSGDQGNGASYHPSISGSGREVAYYSTADNLDQGDNNGASDIFVHNRDFNWTELVSRGPGGALANGNSNTPCLSEDGTQLVFRSQASNLDPRDPQSEPDIYHVDLTTGAIQLVSVNHLGASGAHPAGDGRLARNGRYVAFSTESQMLPGHSGERDVYVRDLAKQRTWLVSRPTGAAKFGDTSSYQCELTADASEVVFITEAALDPADVNGISDVYVRRMIADPKPYCTAESTLEGCLPTIAIDGIPSASETSGFELTAGNVPPNRAGMLFYGFSGRANIPFKGGTLCVAAPLFRGPVLHSGNHGMGACTGQLVIDMNAFAAGAAGGNPHPALALPGKQVHAQFWGRDHPSKHGAFMTEGIQFVVGP